MTTHLHSLTYFSRNLITGTMTEQTAEIERILTSARKNNAARNVTGGLLFSKDCFAQVLEGKVDDVEAIFSRVQSDPRHSDVRILQFEPIGSRSFGNWAMAFAGCAAPDDERLDVAGILQHPSRFDSKEVGRLVVDVLTDLIHNFDSAISGA